jgi:hypothetical protein
MGAYREQEKLGYNALLAKMEHALPLSRNIANTNGAHYVTSKVLKGFLGGGETNDQNIVIMTQFIDIVFPEFRHNHRPS